MPKGAELEPRGGLFRFLRNLVFVQHYSGFACFFGLSMAPGRPKVDEKSVIPAGTSTKSYFAAKMRHRCSQSCPRGGRLAPDGAQMAPRRRLRGAPGAPQSRAKADFGDGLWRLGAKAAFLGPQGYPPARFFDHLCWFICAFSCEKKHSFINRSNANATPCPKLG